MTTDQTQTLGIILGIAVGINLIVFGSVFLYCSIDILKSTIKKNKKNKKR